jgi:hypothetical protein
MLLEHRAAVRDSESLKAALQNPDGIDVGLGFGAEPAFADVVCPRIECRLSKTLTGKTWLAALCDNGLAWSCGPFQNDKSRLWKPVAD